MRSVLFRALACTVVSVAVCGPPASAQLVATEAAAQRVDDIRLRHAETVVTTANHWLSTYGLLKPELRQILEPLAVAVARYRRHSMAYLIAEWPERALERALGRVDKFNLTHNVVDQLETQIDSTGEVVHMIGRRELNGQRYDYVPDEALLLSVGGHEFVDPSVYGRRARQASKEGLPVHGIALGDAFAWSEEPYRRLDAQERVEAKVPANADAVFVGDALVVLDQPEAFSELRSELIARESFRGPVLVDDPPEDEDKRLLFDRAWTVGPKRILWVPVDLASAPGSDFRRSPDTDAMIAQADEWVRTVSRDLTNIEVEYFPDVLRYPADTQSRFETYPSSLILVGRQALGDYDRAHGGTGRWLATSWDRVIFVLGDVLLKPSPEPDDPDPIARGAFGSDARYMVFYGLPRSFPETLNHELGHTYAMSHVWYWRATTSDQVGPGAANGMLYDYMGHLGDDNRAHPSAGQKYYSYWLPDAEWLDATAGGTFRIVAHDNGPIGFVRALRIMTSDDREYWVDMRRLFPEAPTLHNGVQIYYHEPPPGIDPPANWFVVAPRPIVLDVDSPFLVGDVFTDAGRGLRITVDAVGLDPLAGGVHYADVTVERF